jgi:PAS domain S-box-containing protein
MFVIVMVTALGCIVWKLLSRSYAALDRLSRERAMIAESVSEGICGLDGTGCVTFINVAGAALLGHTPADLVGRDFREIVGETDRDESATGAGDPPEARTWKTGERCQVLDGEFRRRDGVRFAVEYSTNAIRSQRHVTGVVLVFHDVSERRKADAKIRESENQLAGTQEITHVGNWEWNLADGGGTWSREMHRICGVRRNQIESARGAFLQIVHPDDRPLLESTLDQAIDRREAFSLECRILRRDGGWRVLHLRGRPELEADGRPARIVGTAQDVTERKEAERALQLSEQRFRCLVDVTSEWVWVVNCSGSVTYSNPAIQQLSGDHPVELIGAKWWDRAHASDSKALEALVATCVTDRRGWTGVVVRWRHKDGSYRLMESSAVPILGASGEVLGVLGISHDVSERQRLETQRARGRQFELEEQFVSRVSHELRSPITVLHQFLTILLDGEAGELQANQREHLEIMLRNAQHLRSMVDDLLDVGRLKSGKLVINPRRFPLQAIVREGLDSIAARAEKKNIVMVLNGDPEQPQAVGDPQRVRQILGNILDNALAFTPEQGQITVTVATDRDNAGFLRVSVADTGPGIALADHKDIFQHLRQSAGTTGQRTKGLGLGLYICRELVLQQGGWIWVESKPGAGSAFHFTLPALSME